MEFLIQRVPNILVGNQLCKSFKNNENLDPFIWTYLRLQEIEIEYGLNIQILVKKLDYKNRLKFILNIEILI